MALKQSHNLYSQADSVYCFVLVFEGPLFPLREFFERGCVSKTCELST